MPGRVRRMWPARSGHAGGPKMDFAVLGVLEVTAGAEPIPLGGNRQRTA